MNLRFPILELSFMIGSKGYNSKFKAIRNPGVFTEPRFWELLEKVRLWGYPSESSHLCYSCFLSMNHIEIYWSHTGSSQRVREFFNSTPKDEDQWHWSWELPQMFYPNYKNVVLNDSLKQKIYPYLIFSPFFTKINEEVRQGRVYPIQKVTQTEEAMVCVAYSWITKQYHPWVQKGIWLLVK